MANRYWVGGAGSWNGTNTTNWSDTSGGAGGASVPTSADDVFFDSNSNGASSFTVTLATGNTGAKSITCTGFTRTLTGSASITVSGNVTLVSGMTFSCSGTWTFNASATIVSAGKTFAPITVNGVGITVQQGDALTLGNSRNLVLTNGTFLTNNYNLTCNGISTSNSNVRTLNLGTSAVTFGGSTGFSAVTSTNLTFSGASASILFTYSLSSASTTLSGVGLSFGNITVGSYTNLSVGGSGSTIANLTLNAVLGATQYIQFANDITISGTLTINSPTYAAYRRLLRSSLIGTQVTLTCNAVSSLSDVDFRDISFAGNCISGGNITGTRLGDCKGNSNITFGAGKDVFFVGSTSPSYDDFYWSPNAWSLSYGGSSDTNAFPLPQDSAYVTDYSPSAGGSFNIPGGYYVKNLVFSRSNALTLSGASSGEINILGDLYISGSAVSTIINYGTSFYMPGRATQVVTSNGADLTYASFYPGTNTTLLLGSALTCNWVAQYQSTNTSVAIDDGGYNLTAFFVDINDGSISIAGVWVIYSSIYIETGNVTVDIASDAAQIIFTNTSAAYCVTYGQTMPKIVHLGSINLTLNDLSGSVVYKGVSVLNHAPLKFVPLLSNGNWSLYTFLEEFDVSGSPGSLVSLGSINATPVRIAKPGQWAIGANSTVTSCQNVIAADAGQGGQDYIAASYIIGVALGGGFFLE